MVHRLLLVFSDWLTSHFEVSERRTSLLFIFLLTRLIILSLLSHFKTSKRWLWLTWIWLRLGRLPSHFETSEWWLWLILLFTFLILSSIWGHFKVTETWTLICWHCIFRLALTKSTLVINLWLLWGHFKITETATSLIIRCLIHFKRRKRRLRLILSSTLIRIGNLVFIKMTRFLVPSSFIPFKLVQLILVEISCHLNLL